MYYFILHLILLENNFSSLELPYKPPASIENNEGYSMLCTDGVFPIEPFRIKGMLPIEMSLKLTKIF